MNFEQLLDGATKGRWMRIPYEDIVWTQLNDGCRGLPVVQAANYKGPQFQGDLSFIARCNPAVMREVWAALKLANAPFTDHSDAELQLASEHIAMMTDDPEIHQKAKMAWAVRRALALLDGQTEKGGVE